MKSTVAELPALGASEENLIVLGTVSDIVEDQFRRLFDDLDIKNVHFYPGRKAGDLPAVGKGTRVIAAQPFVGETARALIERGAELISAPFPLGAEGSKAGLRQLPRLTVSIRSGHSKCSKCRISAQNAQCRCIAQSSRGNGFTSCLIRNLKFPWPVSFQRSVA